MFQTQKSEIAPLETKLVFERQAEMLLTVSPKTQVSSLIAAIKENNSDEFCNILNLETDPLGARAIDEVDAEYHGSVLYWAAACGRAYFIKLLVEAGADVNTPNNGGVTPVCVAARQGHAETITVLKALGANVDVPTKDGVTPLCIAASMGHAETVSALLEVGVDASINTREGTALERAQQGQNPGCLEAVRLLEAHLKQYPNGIKQVASILPVATNLPSKNVLNQKAEQTVESLMPEAHRNVDVEAKAGRDVTTVVGGIRGDGEIVIGGGNTSTQSQNAKHSSASTSDCHRDPVLRQGIKAVSKCFTPYRVLFAGAVGLAYYFNLQRTSSFMPPHIAAQQEQIEPINILNTEGAGLDSSINGDGETLVDITANQVNAGAITILKGIDENVDVSEGNKLTLPSALNREEQMAVEVEQASEIEPLKRAHEQESEQIRALKEALENQQKDFKKQFSELQQILEQKRAENEKLIQVGTVAYDRPKGWL